MLKRLGASFPEELESLYHATVATEGVTTSDGEANGMSIIDSRLAGSGANAFENMVVMIWPGRYDHVDVRPVAAFNNGTGELAMESTFREGQVAAGTPYMILTFGSSGGGAPPPVSPNVGLWMMGLCDPGMAASTTAIQCSNLPSFPSGAFSGEFWMQVIYNASVPGTAPELEIRQITSYDAATRTFTVDAFSVNVEANDIVAIVHESIYLWSHIKSDLEVVDSPQVDQDSIEVARATIHNQRVDTAVVATTEYSGATVNVDRYRIGTDSAWTNIVNDSAMTEVAGYASYAYTFPAVSWQNGDLFRIRVSGIIVEIPVASGQTFHVPEMSAWGVIGGVSSVMKKLNLLQTALFMADYDPFDKAVAAPVATSRWTAENYTGAAEDSTADINTTVAGKAYLIADPSAAPAATSIWLRHNPVRTSKHFTAIIDAAYTWGTPGVAASQAGLAVTKGAAYDANNSLFLYRQKTSGGTNNIAVSGALNGVAITGGTAVVTDDSISLAIERFGTIWRFYYSLSPAPNYEWNLICQEDDASAYMTGSVSLAPFAYSPGAADAESVQVDVDNFKYYTNLGYLEEILGNQLQAPAGPGVEQTIHQALKGIMQALGIVAGGGTGFEVDDTGTSAYEAIAGVNEAVWLTGAAQRSLADMPYLQILGNIVSTPLVDQNAATVVASLVLHNQRPDSDTIQVAEITDADIDINRYRYGTDAGFVSIVSDQDMTIANGGASYAYTFPNASWSNGDLVQVILRDIAVTVAGQAFSVPSISLYGVVGGLPGRDTTPNEDGPPLERLESLKDTVGAYAQLATPTDPTWDDVNKWWEGNSLALLQKILMYLGAGDGAGNVEVTEDTSIPGRLAQDTDSALNRIGNLTARANDGSLATALGLDNLPDVASGDLYTLLFRFMINTAIATPTTKTGLQYLQAIGSDDANNDFESTNVVANIDGSILERLEAISSGIVVGSGTFTTSSATVPADTSQGAKDDNYYKGCLLIPLSGACILQPRLITGSATGTGVFTLDAEEPFTAAPGLVTYIIVATEASLVPATDSTNNTTTAHVIGSKADTIPTMDSAPAATDSLVRLAKAILERIGATPADPDDSILTNLGQRDDTATSDDLSDVTTTSVEAKLRRLLLRFSADAFDPSIGGAARTTVEAAFAALGTALGAEYDGTPDLYDSIVTGQDSSAIAGNEDGSVEERLEALKLNAALLDMALLAEHDEFDVADADADTERWNVGYFNGTEGGSADINTTTAGKLHVAVDPDGTPTAAGYAASLAQPITNKYFNSLVDVDAAFGTPDASWATVGMRISTPAYDANNVIYAQRQCSSGGDLNRIVVGAIFNSINQGEVTFATSDASLALRIERADNVWRCYYSLSQSPDYVWVLLQQYEDTSESMDSAVSVYLDAYSPGNADAQTALADFDNFKLYYGIRGIVQALGGDYDSSAAAADEDGSIIERLEQLQEAVNKGTGSDLPANKSLYDIIGTGYTDAGGAFNADSLWDDLRTLAQYIIDGTAGGEAGTVLPAGKSLRDLLGTAYVDAGGNPDVDNLQAHLAAFIGNGAGTQLAAGKSLIDTMMLDIHLDHLQSAACADTSDPVDMTAEVVDNSVIANILTKEGDTSDYDRRTDSLEALSEALNSLSANQLTLRQAFNTTVTAINTSVTLFALDALGGPIKDINVRFYLDSDVAATFTPAWYISRPGDTATLTLQSIPAIATIVTPAAAAVYAYEFPGDLGEGLQLEFRVAQDNNGDATNVIDATLSYIA